MSDRDIVSRSGAGAEPTDPAVAADPSRNGRDRAPRGGDGRGNRGPLDPLFGVRAADIEPYTGLRYLSKLFRMIAIVLVIMLLAEVVTGIVRQGLESVPTLVSEVSRLIVLAGLLWGVGDLAVLLVDVGHDVRAVRILMGRQTSHATQPSPSAHENSVARPAIVADTPVTPLAPPNERRG